MPSSTVGRAAQLPRRRPWRNGVLILVVLAALFWTSAAAFAQTSTQFSLGCWSITSGGGGQISGAQFRIVNAITWSGGEIQSSNFRIRNNHLAAWRTVSPDPSNPPVIAPGSLYLPVVWGQGLILDNLCN